MDKLKELFQNIELAIRHLLSGFAIYAIYLLGLCDPSSHIKQIIAEPLLVGFGIGAVGFVSYSIYRVAFWAVGDDIAFRRKWSSTAQAEEEGASSYAEAYAKVLLWRRTDDFPQSLSTYLHYRWAVVHFTFIVALALLFALLKKESGSVIDVEFTYAVGLFVTCTFFAVWQARVLFKVDGALYKIRRSQSKSQEAGEIIRE